MSETVIESLVVRLLADADDLIKGMGDVQKATHNAAQAIEREGKRIEGFTSTIKGFASNAASALASLGTAGLLKEAFSAFADAEGTSLRLNAALEANGRDVRALRADYERFAEAMQDVTLAEDDAVLKMLQVAESMDLTGDSAKRAVKNAVSLAAAKGGEAESYLRLTAALEQGQTEMLGRMFPALRSIKDESLRAAKAQELLAKMFDVAKAEAASSAGIIKAFRRDVGNLLEDFGAFIAQGIRPVVTWLQQGVAWFKSLSDETKRAITVAAALIAGFLALGPAIAAIGLVAGTVFNPITLAIAAVIAATSAWVNHMGGIEQAWAAVTSAAAAAWGWVQPAVVKVQQVWGVVKAGATSAWKWVSDRATEAWDAITAKAQAVWEWSAPIRQALIPLWGAMASAASAAWDAVQGYAAVAMEFVSGTAGQLWTYITEIWQSVAEYTGITWDGIRTTIVETLYQAEFMFRNFGQVAEYTWAGVKLSFVQAWNYIEHVLTVVIPATAKWFAEDWRNIFTDVFNWTKTVFSNLAQNIITIIKNIPALIKGDVAFSDLWKPLQEGFVRASKELDIPERVKGELEMQLEAEFNAKGEALTQSFKEFREQKDAQFADAQFAVEKLIPPEAVEKGKNDATDLGSGIGTAFAAAAGKEMQRVDSVLTGSAEALSRIAAFQDRIGPDREGGKGKGTSGESKRFDAAVRNGAEGSQKQQKQEDLLRQIARSTQKLADQPSIELAPLSLA